MEGAIIIKFHNGIASADIQLLGSLEERVHLVRMLPGMAEELGEKILRDCIAEPAEKNVLKPDIQVSGDIPDVQMSDNL